MCARVCAWNHLWGAVSICGVQWPEPQGKGNLMALRRWTLVMKLQGLEMLSPLD